MEKEIKNNAYVYLHRRLDTNEVFYVGIGTAKNFIRAYVSSSRTRYWKNVVKKHGLLIEILHKNLTWEEACLKEIELILLYGRKDLDTGILVNMTNGGEGASGTIISEKTRQKMKNHKKQIFTQETREKMRLAKLGTKQSPELIQKRMKNMIGRIMKPEHIKTQTDKKKLLILNTQTGIYYLGVKEAAESCYIKHGTLQATLKGAIKNKTNFIYC